MLRPKKGSTGFTLIEIIIVLAVIGMLAAIAVPNVTGFLSSGKHTAFDADQRILQAAVDGWRTDIYQRAGNQWPTVGGGKGPLVDAPANGVDIGTDSTVIKVGLLSTGGQLKGTDAVKSFAYSTGTGTGATNSPIGSYVWYVDSSGRVQARKWTDTDSDGVIALSELAGTDGFATDVYP